MDQISLSQVNYHVWVLVGDGLVEAAGQARLGEGVSYRATAKGREVIALIGVIPCKEQGIYSNLPQGKSAPADPVPRHSASPVAPVGDARRQGQERERPPAGISSTSA
jgi:hypothetical protein